LEQNSRSARTVAGIALAHHERLWGICLGIAIYVVGLTVFMLPYELVTGGVTGIAAIVYYATGIPVQWTYFAINAALLIAAVRVLGWNFCAKTIVATFIMTAFISIGQTLVNGADGIPPQVVGDQVFMACVLGAVLEGCGLAIVFLSGGSTGGTDIIAAMVNKYKNMSFGQLFVIMDGIIIASSYFVFGNWTRVVMGFCLMTISSYTLDYVMNSAHQSVQFLIVSNRHEEIAEHVNRELNRGVTVLYGEGFYSKEERRVLLILARRRESVRIFRLIKEIDPAAFVSQSNVVGVYGEGFDKIKT